MPCVVLRVQCVMAAQCQGFSVIPQECIVVNLFVKITMYALNVRQIEVSRFRGPCGRLVLN